MEKEHLKLQLAGVAPKEFPAAKLNVVPQSGTSY